jgi:hypothetical protein
VYLDNYFTSIALFKELRDIQCGACGTTRPQNSITKQLAELKDHVKSIRWGTLYASEEQGVLCIAWQDNNIVFMLFSIHSPNSFITTKRKRPSKTSTNAAIARAPFGDEVEKEQPIPTIINDYNHYMGGVDIANQFRSNYTIHRRSRRSWFPLLFFFLDAAIINAFRIQTIYKQQHGASKRELPSHLAFRETLYHQLFAFANRIQPPQQPTRGHQRVKLGDRLDCLQCKVKRSQSKVKLKRGRSTSGCLECGNAHLCVKGGCWDEWHGVAS